MIRIETEIPIKDAITNENGQNSQIFFNMYFLSLIQVFSLNVFYNVLAKMCNT
jgi:hypothetical protein